MTKEEFGKLKETVAYFGHWYDVIGEERISILEKSIEYIAKLEKENAELKEQNSHLYNDLTITEAENAERKGQLTKAKEIIKNLLILKNDHYGNTKMEWRVEVTEQAEQFLKEIEK